MDMDKYEHGVPSWVDLGAPDPAKAGEFYKALWGWDLLVGPPEAGGYTMCEVRGRAVAGIGPQQNPGPPVWSTYVNVDNADDVAKKVKDNGGTLFMEPFDVLDVGRMAIFADPAGAVIGIWEPKAHTGAGIVNENGTYCWSELVTTDLEGAKTFYGAVFGWGPGGVPEYTEWQVGGRSVGGGMLKPPEMPAEVPNHWAVYFAVDDTDATVARVVELGGSTIMPPMDIEPGRFAVLADPQGAVFNVLQLKQAAG